MYGIIRVFHDGRVVFAAPAQNVICALYASPNRCRVWVRGLPDCIDDVPCSAEDIGKALVLAQKEYSDNIDIGTAPDA